MRKQFFPSTTNCSVLPAIFTLFWVALGTEGRRCRTLPFKPPIEGQALQNHTIDVTKNVTLVTCFRKCYLKERCVSFNYGDLSDEGQICEVSSSSDHLRHPRDLVPKAGFVYHYAENGCSRDPCAPNATCIPGDGEDDYECLSASCKKIQMDDSSKIENKFYNLATGGMTLQAYCHMTSIPGCGEGPWTMVMKINGSKDTFKYDSTLWTNQKEYNPSGGGTGFDDMQETKLPTYWRTPFTKLCLGMRSEGNIKWLSIIHSAQSLYHLLKDDNHTPTTLGREAWLSYMPGAQLQPNCNREGFNTRSDRSYNSRLGVRVGIIANNQNDCQTCNSYVGFGSNTKYNSCGFRCSLTYNCDSNTHAPAFGYILVQ